MNLATWQQQQPQRCENPPVERRMIDFNTALSQNLFEIASETE